MNAKYNRSKPVLSAAAILLLGGVMSVNPALAANCQATTVIDLKPISAQYNYQPNNQSTIRMFVSGKVKNASSIEYRGNGQGTSASRIHIVAEDGRGKNQVLDTITVTDRLHPYDGKTGITARGRLVIPAVNLHDFQVKLKATIENPGCSSSHTRTIKGKFP